MTAAAIEQPVQAAPRARSSTDRLLAALPLATVFLWVCLIYAYQAWAHKTPWLYSDEIEYTDISRAIAATGHPALRGAPHGFDSLYVYLIAPVWWIHSTAVAYAVAKDIGVLVMASAIFPTYSLARMLVRPWPALAAATLTVVAPALSYSAFLITEPLAYLWAAVAFWLIVRALTTRRWPWIVAAVVMAVGASSARSELQVVPIIAVGAAAWYLWTSDAAVRRRQSWTFVHWTAVAIGLVALSYVAERAAGHFSSGWHVALVDVPDRTVRYGVWAAGALAIGLAVLPVVAGLTTLARPRDEPRTPAHRGFVGVFGSALVMFCLYTAAKAAYLSTTFAVLVEERNLIYLTPLIAVAFAVWLDRPRVNLVALGLSGAAVGYLISATPYQLSLHPYAEAPGLAVLAWANRHFHWGDPMVRRTLYEALALSLVLVAVVSFRESWARAARPVLVLATLGVLAWTLTGELSAANGSNSLASRFYHGLPHPLNWIDRADGGATTAYLGSGIQDGNGVWSFEFWNRSLQRIGSLDGTAPGPGATVRPEAYRADGAVVNDPHVPYVLASRGIDVAGTPVLHKAGFTLLRMHGPLRLRSSVTGVSPDGWSGASATYSRYAVPVPQTGILTVRLSRQDWPVSGRVVLRIGTLVPPTPKVLANPCYTNPCGSLDPQIGRVTAVRRWKIVTGEVKTFQIRVRTPFQLDLTSDTFSPVDYGAYDTRKLGVQPSFTFTPSR